ncbi:RNA polymerase sigma factor SigM [Rhodococcoides kyotonense]|uniref:RNA polymerase sigma-70 factor, ECF subfamily n=1 Tax=Rhodococcoides kyotonense TaxID=398843 RepID=A0A239KAC8_9NOCA|nr:RNA polymerase sigma factor SigM [Rhodococcus kyotonensis]SNT15347.1 RNA polymerase sigma-70 factor, ECF subfamily [Rhodococcus kyotonensis]
MGIFGINREAGGLLSGRSDVELLTAHVRGDPDAFSALVHRHHEHLWMTARRTSYTSEDAADALQEALLSAHRTAGSFRADAAVRSWLHKIVVNACLDRIRRNRSRPTTPLTDADVQEPADARDRMSDVETSIEVRTALMALPPEQRAAVVAVDMEGYSVADAAALLGVPTGTIKSRCARARQKLAVQLQDLRDDGNR